MTEFWERLAHLEEAPVVDFYGIVSSGAWADLDLTRPREPDSLGHASFDFEVWRVDSNEGGKGEIQTTWFEMIVMVSDQQEWDSLVGLQDILYAHPIRPIVHLKAKVAHNQNGWQEALFVAFVSMVSDDAELNELHHQLSRYVILNEPPLPQLDLSGSSSIGADWRGTIRLPLWDGSYVEGEPDCDADEVSGYELTIQSVPPPGVRVGYQGIPPSPEQVVAYVSLTESSQTVRDSVMQSIFEVYPQWQAEYGADPEYMPDVNEPQQLQPLVFLEDVIIRCETKDGCAYVYLRLFTRWDSGRPWGALLHRDRVLAVGRHEDIWDTVQQDLESG